MTPAPGPLRLDPVPGVPEVRAGDDLAALLLSALEGSGLDLADGDVLVVSSKCVSKAAGLRADAAGRVGTVLAESVRVVAERATPGGLTRIVEAAAGPVMAGAGIDASNTGSPGDDDVLLLPRDPDAAAADLLAALTAGLARRGAPARIGVVVSDTAGRPWRGGQVDFALGAAGLGVVEDLRGRVDADGRPLAVTTRALGDEIASAADLVKGKAAGVAACRLRGLAADVHGEVDRGGGARSLVRTGPGDWFALGHVEAVRAALGAPPGTPEAVDVGVPAAGIEEDAAERLERACRLAGLAGTHGPVASWHPRAALVDDRLDPGDARFHVVQLGVRVEADDEFALGFVVARLLVALAAEGLTGRVTRRDEAPAAGRGPEALVLVV